MTELIRNERNLFSQDRCFFRTSVLPPPHQRRKEDLLRASGLTSQRRLATLMYSAKRPGQMVWSLLGSKDFRFEFCQKFDPGVLQSRSMYVLLRRACYILVVKYRGMSIPTPG